MKLRPISKGEQFHCWTVGDLLPKKCYLCKCLCGKLQKVRAHDLLNGKSKMCKSCSISISKKGHGVSSGKERSQEYISWQHLIGRCLNPNNKDYPNYGGRGITVCDAWKDSFEAFYMDMGSAPKGHTIDRIDYNGHYEKSNCVWSDKITQNRNRRCNISIEYQGDTKVLSEWLDIFKVQKPNTVYKQISRGKDPKQALKEAIEKTINEKDTTDQRL